MTSLSLYLRFSDQNFIAMRMGPGKVVLAKGQPVYPNKNLL
jgi:hypothetical protein